MIKLPTNNIAAEAHYQVVKPLVQEWIGKVLQRGHVVLNEVKYDVSPVLRRYLLELGTGDLYLRPLISASAGDLEGVIAGMLAHLPDSMTPGTANNIILKNIFVTHAYEDTANFKKLDFIKRIELDTCPYCNRSYIYHLEDGAIKPQLDHFFPKSVFPFLGVSFYNLIPCCQTCNGFGVKAENDPRQLRLTNPYLLDPEEFKFTFKVKDIKFLNPLADKSSIEVRFKNALAGHVAAFRLDELYAQHADHVLELIVKSKVAYHERYREYLNSYQGITLSSEEIDQLIIGTYSNPKDVHKRPLTKLYQDIARKLSIIE